VNQIQAKAIVLSRTDYGEADRIVTVLTRDHGKVSLMARGVRRLRSKLAGGIELFSTAEISYIRGRGEISTITSARLLVYYSKIVQDIERVQLGYELIKLLHRATEDQPEPEYYDLLEAAFKALDSLSIRTELIKTWFQAQLLSFAGHSPNLTTDLRDKRLTESNQYEFDFEAVAFSVHPDGHFSSDAIKFLRLIFSGNPPQVLQQVTGYEELLPICAPLVQTMLQTYIRI